MTESLKTEEEPKPKVYSSRFVEHFDFIPPPELLEIIEEGNAISNDAKLNKNLLSLLSPSNEKKPKKIMIADPLIYSSKPNPIRSMSSESTKEPDPQLKATKASGSRNRSHSNPTPLHSHFLNGNPSSPSSSVQAKSRLTDSKIEGTGIKPVMKTSKSFTTNANHSMPSNINSIRPNPIPSKSELPAKPKLSKKQLNRADFIICRYDYWGHFLKLLISWLNEVIRTTSQSENSFSSFLKETKSFFKERREVESMDGANTVIQDSTANVNTQRQVFVGKLKSQIPVFEKLKKESVKVIKQLRARPDLEQEEFLKRAGVTLQYMSQLAKACTAARRTVKKGSQLINDPWLVNLYVLRQLKKEVDEDNRLRKLIVPIQQSVREYENRVLNAAEETLKICSEFPNLTSDKVGRLQAILSKATEENWDNFVQKNKKLVVDEDHPQKDYLKINYPYRNDPFVLTLLKGTLEKQGGILNKFTPSYFVLTESGFLYQFKMTDKVSPEYTIYIPNSIITTSVDLNPSSQKSTEMAEKNNTKYYFFDIQRKGSKLQRDKIYTFRTTSFEEMAVWCRLLHRVAQRPLSALLYTQPNAIHQQSDTDAPINYNSAKFSFVPSIEDNINQTEAQQESTPPPSPTPVDNDVKSIDYSIKMASSISDADVLSIESTNDIVNDKNNIYIPQLNQQSW